MYKLLTSKGQMFAVVLGVLSVLIALGSIIGGVKSNYSMSDDLNSILKNNAEANFDFFNPAINIVFILLVVAMALALIFGLKSIITDPKGSMKVIIGLALVGILFFILYSTADVAGTEKLTALVGKHNMSDGISKMISGGIKTAVYAAILAMAAAFVMEILNLFK